MDIGFNVMHNEWNATVRYDLYVRGKNVLKFDAVCKIEDE